MDAIETIKGRKILVVDDEADVLDSLVDLLSVCRIDTARTFEDGRRLLEENRYDVAILDIMGVDGFKLLEVAGKRGVPVLMLTAHGLSEENLKRSLEEGASYYAPKDEISRIELFVADIIEAKERNKNVLVKWFERLSSYYDTRFSGPDWREKDQEFFKRKMKELPPI